MTKLLQKMHRKPALRPRRIGEFYTCPHCNKTWVTAWDPIGRLDWFAV